MSYLIAEDYTPLKVDIVTPYNVSGSDWLLSAPTALQTNIAVSSTTITLYSGASYYIEASVAALCTSGNGTLTWQLYDATNGALIGQDAFFSIGNWGDRPRVGRKVAKALILDSEIAGSKDVRVRLTSAVGTGWSYSVTLGVGLNGLSYGGYPSIRIWQLPTP